MDNIIMEAIKAEVIKIISHLVEFPSDEIQADMSIKDDLGADELDAIYILIAIEDKYGFYFENDALQNYRKIGDFIKEIKSRLDKKLLMGKCISLRKYKLEKEINRNSEMVQTDGIETTQGRTKCKIWSLEVL